MVIYLYILNFIHTKERLGIISKHPISLIAIMSKFGQRLKQYNIQHTADIIPILKPSSWGYFQAVKHQPVEAVYNI